MARLLIDPPVTPFDSLARIEAWLGELRRLITQYDDDPDALEDIAFAEQQAQMFLAFAQQKLPRPRPLDGLTLDDTDAT